MTTSDVAKVLDTVLSIPGMNEMVKIDFKISRKNVLLLNSVIQRGLNAKEDGSSSLLENLPKENIEELKSFSGDCLQKAGLTELNEKLKSFQK